MTQKELLYLEDAVGHEKNIILILEESVKMIKDDCLREFLKKELKKHGSYKCKMMSFMEDMANE